MNDRFVPRKRTALDSRVWWCIFDTLRGCWSTYLCHGHYRTKKECYLCNRARKEYFQR